MTTNDSEGSGRPARRRLVVGYDRSDAAGTAVRWAAVEAARRGLPLTVVHVVDLGGLDIDPTVAHVDDWIGPALDAGRAVAEEGAGLAREATTGISVDAAVGSGVVARVLADESRRAALVVVGSRGRGDVSGASWGSVALAVAVHASCPTAIVRGDHPAVPGPDHPVVVGVDGSPSATAALDVAAGLAADTGAPLRIVSAWRRPTAYALRAVSTSYDLNELARATAEQARERARERAMGHHPDLAVSAVTEEGPAAEVLTDAAGSTGVLVIGTRGHGAFSSLLLGSVSHAAVHYARCPVVIVQRRPTQSSDKPSYVEHVEV